MLLTLPPRIVRTLRTQLQHDDLDHIVIVVECFRGSPDQRVLCQQIEICGDDLHHVTLLRLGHDTRKVPHPGSLMPFLDMVARRVHELPRGDPLQCPIGDDIVSVTLKIRGVEETFSCLASEDARRRHEQVLSPGALRLVELMERLVKETSREANSPEAIAQTLVGADEELPSRVGRFDVEAVLARWHHGTILRVRDPAQHQSVAMKLGYRMGSLCTRMRLEREHQILTAIDHPNVVTAHDVGLASRRPFMTMELVLGSPLDESACVHRASRADRIAALVQAGRGLAAAHAAGFVHGNFGPSNALIDTDDRVRVIGFHWAHAVDESPIPPSFGGSFMPSSAAPEVLASGHRGAHSDQFSLCVALYEALYGVRPFAGRTPAELAHQVLTGDLRPPPDDSVPHHIRDAVLQGLCLTAADRWPSVGALLDELGDA